VFLGGFDVVARQPDLPRVIQKAKQRNVGVVVMKTLMGARLNDMRPFERDGATFAQAAFRWVLSDPNVDGLIVSMTNRESIDEYLGASGSRTVSTEDLPLLERYARVNGVLQAPLRCVRGRVSGRSRDCGRDAHADVCGRLRRLADGAR
jgi:predicted aldo/keto reductase-like oxidoreductase